MANVTKMKLGNQVQQGANERH